MSDQKLIGNRYELVRKIAEGGFSDVFEGFDTVLSRPIALKRFKPDTSGATDAFDMLESEARTTANLDHRNIVQVIDFCRQDNELFMIMPFIKGLDLHDLIRTAKTVNKPIPFGLGAHIIAEVCQALYYAHNATEKTGHTYVPLHLIHLDISPANIMIAADGSTKVIDFGIAKVYSRRKSSLRDAGLRGKISYMSPEQIRGQMMDHRSDIFSLGIVMYETLTGEKPYDSQRATHLIEEIKEVRISLDKFTRHKLPFELQTVILKAIQKNPQERYQTAREMFKDLDKWLQNTQATRLHDAVANFVREMANFRKLKAKPEPPEEDSEKTVFLEPDKRDILTAINEDAADDDVDLEKTHFFSYQESPKTKNDDVDENRAHPPVDDDEDKTLFLSPQERLDEDDSKTLFLSSEAGLGDDEDKTLFITPEEERQPEAREKPPEEAPRAAAGDDEKTMFWSGGEDNPQQTDLVDPPGRTPGSLKRPFPFNQSASNLAKSRLAPFIERASDFFSEKARPFFNKHLKTILFGLGGLLFLLLLILLWPSPEVVPPKYYALEINTDNPEASVYVYDKNADERTPKNPDSLLAGSYVVEARLDELLRTKNVVLDTNSHDIEQVFIIFNTTLHFESNPSGALVTLAEDHIAGATPFDTSGVFDGWMKVEMALKGFETLNDSIEIAVMSEQTTGHLKQTDMPDGSYRIAGAFFKPVRFRTVPAGAEILEITDSDTVSRGFADAEEIPLEAGSHSLILRREGNLDKTLTLEVAASKQEIISKREFLLREVTLNAGAGAKVIRLLAANNNVINENHAALPFTFQLPARAYQFHLVRPGYLDKIVRISPNDYGAKNISLKRQTKGVIVKLIDARSRRPVYLGRVGYFQGTIEELGRKQFQWQNINAAGSFAFSLDGFARGQSYVFKGESQGYGPKILKATVSGKPGQEIALKIVKFK